MEIRHCTVLIVGSGPVGCTFARTLIDAGVPSVCVIDAGASLSKRRGEHLKNSFFYQRDRENFGFLIRSHLQPVSVPLDLSSDPNLDPIAFDTVNKRVGRNGQNSEQDPNKNIPAAASSYCVGGMATHWTCATPRAHKIERTDIYSDSEWDEMYIAAEKLIHMTTNSFDDSVRNYIIKKELIEKIPKIVKEEVKEINVKNLPLACHRFGNENRYIKWSGADTVLGDLADEDTKADFQLHAHHRCNKLILSSDQKQIEFAEVEEVLSGKKILIKANMFIVACNAILTPQVLWASGIRPEPLGRYLTEQPMTFCQVVLKKSIVQDIKDISIEPFKSYVQKHMTEHPDDPIPIPLNDHNPMLTLPVSENRPWHAQIHRDHGLTPSNIDSRLIVDLRWFAMTQPKFDNRIYFSETKFDKMDMPQPIFDYQITIKDAEIVHRMMKEMCDVASILGGYIPQSAPRLTVTGLPLHIAGTVRIGRSPKDSVVNKYSRVWQFSNLYLGGNGLIPTATACNPTLTSMGFAVYACKDIIHKLQSSSLPRTLPLHGDGFIRSKL